MDIDNNVLKEWFSAVQVANEHFTNCKINDFKDKHPVEYAYISRFFRLRFELYKDIDALLSLGDIQWFTLTYDNEHDKNQETTKRKSAFKFLNGIFSAFLLVEEYGEDNGRYHIHGFGVYKLTKGFEDFRQWFSGQNIKTLNKDNAKKKAKYLTKYAVKALPRLRRSKTLILYKKRFKSARTLEKYGFKSCYNCRCHLAYIWLNRFELLHTL